MRYLPLFLILVGCAPESYTQCEAIKESEQWLARTVETRDELRQEISAMIIENKCDGITPRKLRKILLDMERVR